jgi:hypothetical protein
LTDDGIVTDAQPEPTLDWDYSSLRYSLHGRSLPYCIYPYAHVTVSFRFLPSFSSIRSVMFSNTSTHETYNSSASALHHGMCKSPSITFNQTTKLYIKPVRHVISSPYYSHRFPLGFSPFPPNLFQGPRDVWPQAASKQLPEPRNAGVSDRGAFCYPVVNTEELRPWR